MSTSGDGLGLLIGAGAFMYGASKKTEADKAARTLDIIRADARNRIGQLQTTIKAREADLEGVRAQLRTTTSDYAQVKKQLDATVAARASEQQARAQERANLNTQIRDERERRRAERVAAEARINEGTAREREKDERIATLEARIRELESGS
jgi:hypothetical protein